MARPAGAPTAMLALMESRTPAVVATLKMITIAVEAEEDDQRRVCLRISNGRRVALSGDPVLVGREGTPDAHRSP